MTGILNVETVRPRFAKSATGYTMVLRQGDDAFAVLEALMDEEHIPSATLTGIGFAGSVTFGFYDFEKKAFVPGTYHDVEIASLIGSLAWKEGKPSVHAHAVAGASNFSTVGGHLLALEVGTGSLELYITVHDRMLERQVDPSIGANVLTLE